jgi:hypothetical protein
MSGMSITAEQRANISSYLTEVLLPDSLEAKIREQEIPLLGTTLVGAIAGALVTLASGSSAAILGGAAIGAVIPELLNENLGKFLYPFSGTSARIQADNFYWYLVKRQIFCNLPANTADINDTLVARIAREIENIVPYDGNDFGSKTSVNQFLSAILRSIPVDELRNVIEVAAQRWVGNRNGLALPEVSPGCLTPNIALIPVISDTGRIPFSEKVSTNTWYIGASVAGSYRWRTPFPNQCFRIDGVIAAQPPILNPTLPLVTYAKCDGTFGAVNDLTNLVGVCFRDLEIVSGVPFNLYLTISECSAAPAVHPPAFVQFTTPAQTILEGASATVQAKLAFVGPATPTATVNVELDPNSSATLGSDFTFSPTQLTFGPNNTTQSVTVNVLADTLIEPAERVIFTLTNPTGGAVIGRPNQHVLTIAGDWVKEFDFITNAGGWVATPESRYEPGAGFVHLAATKSRTSARRTFPATFITTVDVHIAAPFPTQADRKQLAVVPIYTAVNTSNPTMQTFTLNANRTELIVDVVGDNNTAGVTVPNLVRVVVRGRGTNPFV